MGGTDFFRNGVLGLFFTASAIASAGGGHLEQLPICYIPGAGGGNENSMVKFPEILAERGIRMVAIETTNKGNVPTRSKLWTKGLADVLKSEPHFRCHVFAYSMGGVLVRYSYHHLQVKVSENKQVPVSDIVASITTFSSPHRGTPLADWLKQYAPALALGLEDLSEEGMDQFNDPRDDNYSPAPEGIPNFSYGTYMNSRNEARSTLTKIGFQVIKSSYENKGRDPRNDGVVPFISQEYGQRVANFNVDHGFFTDDIGIRPWAPDVFELHWRELTGTQNDSVADWDDMDRIMDPVDLARVNFQALR
jgi:hypothetical protein